MTDIPSRRERGTELLRYTAKRKVGKIPAILVGLLTAVLVQIEPLTQGKSWSDISHLSWGTILPPIVVGFLSHYLTVPRQEMTDVNQAYAAYIDHLESSQTPVGSPVSDAGPSRVALAPGSPLTPPAPISTEQMLDRMMAS